METIESDKKCFTNDCELSCSICPALKEHRGMKMEMREKFIAAKKQNTEQSENRLHRISQYCEECVQFTHKKCDGRVAPKKRPTFFGTHVTKIQPSGTDFCKQYEFDVRLYHFQDGSGEIATIKHVRKRQAKRDVEVSNQEHSDVVDLAASLSSADFEGLI